MDKKLNFKFYTIAFFTPIIIMLIAFLANGIFSDYSIIVNDLHSQYINFLTYFRTSLFENGIFYSFSKGLGGNFFGIFSYYLASPLNLFCFLFPIDKMELFVSLTILLRFGLSCVTFCWFLKKQEQCTNNFFILSFGILYSLSSFMVVYNYQILWTDAFILLPIIIGFWQDVLKGKSTVCFVFAYTLLLVSSYYMAYMVGIFCFLLFIHYLISNKNAKLKTTLANCIIPTIICIGLAMWILLPTLFALIQGKLQLNDSALSARWCMFNPFSILPKLFTGSYDSVGTVSAPFIYCGVASIILAVLSLFVKGRATRLKIADFCLLAFFAVSLFIRPIYKAWHMFALTNAFPYRFTFIVVFFILWLAFISVNNIKNINRYIFNIVYPLYFIIMTSLYIILFPQYKKINIVITICLAVSIFILLTLFKNKGNKIIAMAILAIALIDVSFNSYFCIKENYSSLLYQDKSIFTQDITNSNNLLNQIDNNDWHRIIRFEESNGPYVQFTNHSFKHSYNGVYGTFTSLPELNMENINSQIEVSKDLSSSYALISAKYTMTSDSIIDNGEVFPLVYKALSSFQDKFYINNPVPYIKWATNIELDDETDTFLIPESITIAANIAKNNSLKNMVVNSNKITGDIAINFDNQPVCTSIVYDLNWIIKANNIDVEYFQIMDNFIGFTLPKGDYSLTFSYVPKGFKTGIFISIFTALTCLTYFIKKLKYENKKMA